MEQQRGAAACAPLGLPAAGRMLVGAAMLRGCHTLLDNATLQQDRRGAERRAFPTRHLGAAVQPPKAGGGGWRSPRAPQGVRAGWSFLEAQPTTAHPEYRRQSPHPQDPLHPRPHLSPSPTRVHIPLAGLVLSRIQNQPTRAQASRGNPRPSLPSRPRRRAGLRAPPLRRARAARRSRSPCLKSFRTRAASAVT